MATQNFFKLDSGIIINLNYVVEIHANYIRTVRTKEVEKQKDIISLSYNDRERLLEKIFNND